MKRTSRNRILLCLLPPALLLAAAGIFLTQFFTDNKYPGCAPSADGSVGIGAAGVYALTSGWDVFNGLLSPEEARTAEPVERSVTIGERPNLTAYAGRADGSVTYRIVLSGRGACALYLQEVFTSSAVYADGTLLGGTGDPAAGVPFVRDAVYAFALGGRTEIVVQVTAGGHYYGGIYYPPLAGSPAEISRAVSARLALYAAAVALVLCAVLLTLPLARHGGNKTGLPFALLCAFTALSLTYPFAAAAGTHLPVLTYTLTDVCSALALLFALTLAARLAGCQNSRHFLFGGFPAALGFTLFSAVMPPLMTAFPGFATVYGYLVAGFKVALGAYLAAVSAAGFFRAFKKGSPDILSALTLAGGLAYALFVIAGIASIGFFEPAIGFWYEETGALLMTLLFGASMFCRSLNVLRENRRLNDNLAAEVARQTEVITELFEERQRLIRSVSHDLKTPVTAVRSYAEALLAQDNVDDKTRRSLQVIVQRLADFSERYGVLENIGTETPSVPGVVCLNAFVKKWAEENRADAEMDGAVLATRLCREKLSVRAENGKLARILENLVFNAVSFTPAGGKITITLSRNGREAVLAVSDAGPGIPPKLLPHVFEPYVSGREDSDGRGLGLFIVSTLAAALNGRVNADSVPGEGSVFTVSLPLAEEA